MSRAALALLLAAVLGAADEFAITPAVAGGLRYRLGSGWALPLCWGPVRLHLDAAHRIRIEATLGAGATADDLLTMRSGYWVAVGSGPGGHTCTVNGRSWTWEGPVHGGGTLRLTGPAGTSVADAVLALRQICYASTAGPSATDLTARPVAFSLGYRAATDQDPWTSLAGGTVTVIPGPVATGLMRLEPAALVLGSTCAIRSVETACVPAGADLAVAAIASPAGAPTAIGGLPAAFPLAGLQLAATAADTVAGSWDLACTLDNGAQVALPVTVAQPTQALQVAGGPPLEVDCDPAAAPDAIVCGMPATLPAAACAIVAHPRCVRSDPELAAVAAAIVWDDGVLTLDRPRLRALATGPTPLRWLAFALRFAAGDETLLVPCIIHLRVPDPG